MLGSDEIMWLCQITQNLVGRVAKGVPKCLRIRIFVKQAQKYNIRDRLKVGWFIIVSNLVIFCIIWFFHVQYDIPHIINIPDILNFHDIPNIPDIPTIPEIS